MHIHGLPGSVQELLKPLHWRDHPRSIEDITSDPGRYLQSIREEYYRKGLPYDPRLAEGARAEWYLASELRRLLYRQEGHIFNNAKISNENEQASGFGLTSYPDHLILTPGCFLYVETKRWKTPSREMIDLAFAQVESTARNIRQYLSCRGFQHHPLPFLYDDLGTFPVKGPFPIVRKPKGLAAQVQQMNERGYQRDHQHYGGSLYQALAEVFLRATEA